MNGRLVACPACGTLLDAPPEAANCAVRCGACKTRFKLPAKVAVTGDAIASWLWQDPDHDHKPHEALPRDPSNESMVFLADPEAEQTARVRLVRVGSEGALFEFDAPRLLEVPFRTAMPRMCVRCEGRADLIAHPIIYAPHLADSLSLEAEHAAGGLRLRLDDVRGLDSRDMLARLGHVPNVPHPADLAMPYWLCDGCSGIGMISGQANINTGDGSGLCRLRIANLAVAEQFLVALGQGDSVEHAELQLRIDARNRNPWAAIDAAVRNRLEQWYEPGPKETFLAYVPDRDRGISEDGVYGILVTDRRLIYHCQYRHHESPVDMPLHLQWIKRTSKLRLTMRTPRWEISHFALDREGLENLRKALRRAGFPARWY